MRICCCDLPPTHQRVYQRVTVMDPAGDRTYERTFLLCTRCRVVGNVRDVLVDITPAYHEGHHTIRPGAA